MSQNLQEVHVNQFCHLPFTVGMKCGRFDSSTPHFRHKIFLVPFYLRAALLQSFFLRQNMVRRVQQFSAFLANNYKTLSPLSFPNTLHPPSFSTTARGGIYLRPSRGATLP